MWQKCDLFTQNICITLFTVSQKCRKSAAKVPLFRRKSAASPRGGKAAEKRRKSGGKAALLRQAKIHYIAISRIIHEIMLNYQGLRSGHPRQAWINPLSRHTQLPRPRVAFQTLASTHTSAREPRDERSRAERSQVPYFCPESADVRGSNTRCMKSEHPDIRGVSIPILFVCQCTMSIISRASPSEMYGG